MSEPPNELLPSQTATNHASSTLTTEPNKEGTFAIPLPPKPYKPIISKSENEVQSEGSSQGKIREENRRKLQLQKSEGSMTRLSLSSKVYTTERMTMQTS